MIFKMRRGAILAAAASMVTGVASAAPVLQPMDLFRLTAAHDVQISPDGSRLAYVRSDPDIQADRMRRSLRLVTVGDGAERDPGWGEASAPRWSPDGRHLAFLSGGALWTADADGVAAPRQLVGADRSPGPAAWSPDGASVACTVAAPAAGTDRQPAEPTPPSGAHWSPEPIVVTGDRYQSDAAGWGAPVLTGLLIASLRTGEVRTLATPSLDVLDVPAWTPDGAALVFSARSNAPRLGDASVALHRLDVAGGGVRRLTPATPRSNDRAPAVSLDGRSVAYLHYDNRRDIWRQDVRVLDLASGASRDLLPDLDRYVDAVGWSTPHRLVVAYGDEAAEVVGVVDPEAPRPVLQVRVRDADGGVSVSRDGRLGFIRGAPDGPGQVTVADAGGERALTRLNAQLLADRALSRVASFDARSSVDGRRVPGFVMTPPGYVAGRRYPTILFIHGGPYGSEGPEWHAQLQLFAAAGYVVLYANPRGSLGYSFSWTDALPFDAPGHAYDDLMSVVDAAVARGLADPDRLYVTGGSYGGAMTAWIVGTTHRFRAAVAEKPVINAISDELQGDQYDAILMDARGLPWEHPTQWWRSSPLSRVGQVTTPTLLIVGAEDRRTPPEESRQFYAALRLRGVPSELVVYPGATHESLGAPPSQLISLTQRTLEWFKTH